MLRSTAKVSNWRARVVPWMRSPASFSTHSRTCAFRSARSRTLRVGRKLPFTYLTPVSTMLFFCESCGGQALIRKPEPSAHSVLGALHLRYARPGQISTAPSGGCARTFCAMSRRTLESWPVKPCARLSVVWTTTPQTPCPSAAAISASSGKGRSGSRQPWA